MATGIVCLLMGAAMAAQTPAPDPSDALKAETAYWQQVKAAADAQTAAIQAQSAVSLARLGSVQGQTTISGAVDVGSEGPRPEGLLLTAAASDEVAAEIARRIRDSGQLAEAKALLLVTSTDDLSLANLNLYDIQRQLIARQLKNAADRLDKAGRTARAVTPKGFVLPPVTAIGSALDIATKLGSYFRTDYKFGKVDVSPPDRMLINAVAARLQPVVGAGGKIFVPQQLAATGVDALLEELQAPSDQYLALVTKADSLRAVAGQKPEIQAAVAAADGAAKAWEAFAASLTTMPASGPPAIDLILRQKAIKSRLDAHTPLLVLSNASAAGYYTKKNLWTFLGAPPLYAAAAFVASYALLDGADRHVLTSGTVPVHGGYYDVRSVQQRFPSGQAAKRK